MDEAIRIRTRMLIRDHEGRERLFRSTVAEDPEIAQNEEETEGDSG